MDRRCRRFVAVGCCLVWLAAAGCMQFPYFLPEINYAPGVETGCKSDEVHAFRVDITQETEIKEGRSDVSGDVIEYQELTPIPTSPSGATSAQIGLTFASGWRYVGVVNFTSSSTEHGVSLRFYRPGYQTIVLKPGDGMRELDWRKTRDLNAQVKAVDDLLNGEKMRKSQAISVRQVLEPGTKSIGQRDTLEFAAAEYERLARSLSRTDPEDRTIRRDLLEEAARLRALAEGKKR